MPKKRHISLKDLAKELGVSVSTVSRALNDSYEIGPEMRERVKALAEEWNYRPNPFALSLLKNTPVLSALSCRILSLISIRP